jgi:hypothetical protein
MLKEKYFKNKTVWDNYSNIWDAFCSFNKI